MVVLLWHSFDTAAVESKVITKVITKSGVNTYCSVKGREKN